MKIGEGFIETGQGRSVVLLHAFPLSADQWLPQLHRVPPGWRVVAPDLRGFRGERAAFEELIPDDMSIDRYADDVLALMTHLEIPRAVVGGVSMGGYVALSIAARAPERLDGLLLANTRATADTPDGRAGRDRMLDLVRREGAAGVARDMLPKLLGATTSREQPDLVEVVERMICRNTADALGGAIVALRDRPDRSGTLAKIACPTTIVAGEEDKVITRAEADAMQLAIPGARLVVIPRVGHLSNLEDPARFNAALWSVLR